MSRIRVFGALGLLAVSFAFAGAVAPKDDKPAAAQPAPKAVDGHMSHFMDCAKACDDCARICNLCAAHCTKMAVDGKKEHLETVRTCIDCATICNSASAVVIKGGPFSDLICTACAEACKRCGDACEKMGSGDPIMKQCADECRKCEKSCRMMLKHTVKEK
jgi:hypothetical protein